MRNLKLRSLLIFLILTTISFGQQLTKPNTFPVNESDWCGQYDLLQNLQTESPQKYQEYLDSRALLEEHFMNPTQQVAPKGTVYTIPVVFHILHNNGSENISDAQVQSALDILTRDFRKLNTDANNVVSQFLPIVGDAEIEFEFATVAPDGTCFNGITRTVSSQTNSGNGEAQINAIINGNDVYQGVWPHSKYLNIIVCKNLIQGAAGYTFLPWGNATPNAENMYYNSIFILHDYTGAIGTGSIFASRALTHEVGHWLNLSHIWGDGNLGSCGTDYVSDTPQTSGTTYPCTLSQSTCDGTLDNVENYMDYGYCSKMFTNGQVSRMRSALTSSVAGRSNIWTQSNLVEVGATQSGNVSCAFIEASNMVLCEGMSTTYSVTPGDEPILSYSWTFPGGTPGTSTSATPTVTYNTAGTYDVFVDITTASGTGTIQKINFINVESSGSSVALPIFQGFVNSTFPPTSWDSYNGGIQTVTWKRNHQKGTAPTAGNSAMIDYYSEDTSGDVDDLITPVFSLTDYSSAELTFDVAYSPWSYNYIDQLQVLVSPGCGEPFEVVYDKSGSVLQTEAPTQSAYTNPQVWRNETVNLTPYIGNTGVKIKFRGISGYGNYMYLDNINISGVSDSNNPPTPEISTDKTSICPGETITFTDLSTNNPTSWNWTFPGGTPSSSTQQNPIITYNTAGTYDVILEATNQYGSESATFTNKITVNEIPTVTISTPNDVICVGESVTLVASGALAYSWDQGLGNGASKTVTPQGTTTYTVTGTKNGCSNTASITITVVASPATPVIVQDDDDLSVVLGQGETAEWYFEGELVGSGATYHMEEGGNYQVVVTNEGGCTATDSGKFETSTSGIHSEDIDSMIKLFPNPTNDRITITGDLPIHTVTITDNLDRIVRDVQVENQKIVVLNLKHLAAGSYQVYTTFGDTFKTFRVIKN